MRRTSTACAMTTTTTTTTTTGIRFSFELASLRGKAFRALDLYCGSLCWKGATYLSNLLQMLFSCYVLGKAVAAIITMMLMHFNEASDLFGMYDVDFRVYGLGFQGSGIRVLRVYCFVYEVGLVI